MIQQPPFQQLAITTRPPVVRESQSPVNQAAVTAQPTTISQQLRSTASIHQQQSNNMRPPFVGTQIIRPTPTSVNPASMAVPTLQHPSMSHLHQSTVLHQSNQSQPTATTLAGQQLQQTNNQIISSTLEYQRRLQQQKLLQQQQTLLTQQEINQPQSNASTFSKIGTSSSQSSGRVTPIHSAPRLSTNVPQSPLLATNSNVSSIRPSLSSQLPPEPQPIGSAQPPFQSRFGLAHSLTVNRLRELQSRSCTSKRSRPIINENECAERIVSFLSSFIGRLWEAAIEISFKRVDCPAAPFENYVLDDFSYQTEIEQLKSQHEAEALKYKQAIRTQTTSLDDITSLQSTKKKSKDSNDDELNREDEIMESTTKQTKKGLDKKGESTQPDDDSSSSVVALRDLGLEDSLFAGLDEKKEDKIYQKGSKDVAVLSSAAYRRHLIMEAESKARADHTVRRKQAKLTREVKIDDLLTVIHDVNTFQMPMSLRQELIRALNYVLKCSATNTLSTSNKDVSLIGYRAFGQNTYIPKSGSSSSISLYLTDGTAAVMFPSSKDTRSPGVKNRFSNLWISLTSATESTDIRRSKRKDESPSTKTETVIDKPRSKRKRPSPADDQSRIGPSFPQTPMQSPTPFSMIPFSVGPPHPMHAAFHQPNPYFSPGMCQQGILPADALQQQLHHSQPVPSPYLAQRLPVPQLIPTQQGMIYSP